MKTMTSAEFRKGYAKLAERTEVTANGHLIGTWVPVNAPVEKASYWRAITSEDVEDAPYLEALQQDMLASLAPAPTRETQQAERDRILRAVNKGTTRGRPK